MRAARVDANQPLIVDAFRKLGCSVFHCHTVGQGFPDIAVGFLGKTHLIEIKDGAKVPSAQKLTPPEKLFFAEWRGSAAIVNSVEAVQRLVTEWRSATPQEQAKT